MSNCSQNCWIDWHSAVLCFKRLFQIGVWTFSRFMRPLLATILCIWEIWSPRIQCVTYFPVGKKNMAEKKARHRTDFEADRWPETGAFFWPNVMFRKCRPRLPVTNFKWKTVVIHFSQLNECKYIWCACSIFLFNDIIKINELKYSQVVFCTSTLIHKK